MLYFWFVFVLILLSLRISLCFIQLLRCVKGIFFYVDSKPTNYLCKTHMYLVIVCMIKLSIMYILQTLRKLIHVSLWCNKLKLMEISTENSYLVSLIKCVMINICCLHIKVNSKSRSNLNSNIRWERSGSQY